MRKMMFFIGMLFCINIGYAQDTSNEKQFFSITNWLSANTNDVITIENGAGLLVIILITVDKNSSGVAVKNCGTVTKINAGSSALCASSDPANPISLSSDSPSTPAKGTYQIKQQ
jgi:hypothetical protein